MAVAGAERERRDATTDDADRNAADHRRGRARVGLLQRPQAPPAVQDDLIQRARDAARSCQYVPARADGRPVAARVRRTFRFLI